MLPQGAASCLCCGIIESRKHNGIFIMQREMQSGAVPSAEHCAPFPPGLEGSSPQWWREHAVLGTHLYHCPRGLMSIARVCRAQGSKPLSDGTGHCILKSFPSYLFKPEGDCLRKPLGSGGNEISPRKGGRVQ